MSDEITTDQAAALLGVSKKTSQAPPAKPEACELEPLKAAIVVR